MPDSFEISPTILLDAVILSITELDSCKNLT